MNGRESGYSDTVTEKEAAGMLGCTVQSLRTSPEYSRLIRWFAPRGRTMFDRADVQAFIEGQGQAA